MRSRLAHRVVVAALLLPACLVVAGCFPRAAGPRLAHFADQAPAVGEIAPDFTLTDLDGESVRLADRLGERPIVLRFGSHSCPVYRYRRFGIEGLIDDFRDRVDFLVVYTLEAHPEGSASPYDDEEWNPAINRWLGVRWPQPSTDAERLAHARRSHADLELGEEMVVDQLDDAVWQAYGAAASPAFVLDRDGRVALRQVWVDPDPIREALERLLADSESSGDR